MKRCGVNLEVQKIHLKLERFLFRTENCNNLLQFPEGCQNYPQLGEDFEEGQNYPQLGDDFRYAVIQPELC